MEKIVRRPGLKTYESTLRATKKWIREHKEQHSMHSKKYYHKNKDVQNERAKARYHFNKISKELRAICWS